MSDPLQILPLAHRLCLQDCVAASAAAIDTCDVVAAGRVLCPLLGHPAVNAAWARWKQRVAKDPDTEQEGREVCQKRLREAIARGEAAALTERELHDAKEALAREERRERARVAIAEAVSCTLRQF